mgnify:FL=1
MTIMDEMSRKEATDSIEESTEKIDVAAVMNEVRRRVAQKRTEGIYPPEEKSVPEVQLAVENSPAYEDVMWRIETMRSIARLNLDGEPILSHRPILGYFLIRWKKFMRFWTRRYTDSLFLQQSRYNTESSATIASLLEEINQLRAEVNALKNKH